MTRGPYDGVLNIVRFNWPFFAGTSIASIASGALAFSVSSPVWRLLFATVAAGLLIGSVVPLTISHLIYDRSALYRFSWLDRAIGRAETRSAVFCQTGFDESSALLQAYTAPTAWTLLDHYDPARMTEASIQRARRHCPPAAGTLPAPFNSWPTNTASADMAIGMLAVHELRTETERVQWFAEARRVTRAGGRVVVVEHVRDLANVCVFGPGALHFHSVSAWRRSWERAQLRSCDEFRITPWVRVFVLEHA